MTLTSWPLPLCCCQPHPLHCLRLASLKLGEPEAAVPQLRKLHTLLPDNVEVIMVARGLGGGLP